MTTPVAGKYYPVSYADLLSWFGTDGDCLDYLEWVRWPEGFVCPNCDCTRGWLLADNRWMCPDCEFRCSVTAGTAFERTRIPLTVWFTACWLFATSKDGISAKALKRTLGLSSYQTAWTMLHKMRASLILPERTRLSGVVEMDETLIGGTAVGDKGGRTPGEKALVAVAIERKDPRGFGRCRLSVIPDASAPSLRAFALANIEPNSTVISDGWSSYPPALSGSYSHQRHVAPGSLAHQLLPGVHRVSSLLKRWLLGTHQGSVDDAHLPAYLEEFMFRFNRRNSRSPGMLFFRLVEAMVGHEAVTYRELVVNPRPKKEPPTPPTTRGHPASMDRPSVQRPWRSL